MERKQYRGRPGAMGMRGSEKARDFKGTWRKIIRYSRKYLPAVIIALLCAAGGTVMILIGPDKLSDLTAIITEGLATSIDLEAVGGIGMTLAAHYVCGAVLSFIQHFILSTVTQTITRQLRSDISAKINRLPMSYYSRTSTGDVSSRVTNDVDMISQSLNQSIGNMVSAITLFAGSLLMMMITNVPMALTAVAATALRVGLMLLITYPSQ